MTRRVLTLNAGSSSLKFGLFEAEAEPRRVCTGEIDRVGAEDARLKAKGDDGRTLADKAVAAPDQAGALEAALGFLSEGFGTGDVVAVGHRVVHGGERFTEPARLDDDALGALEALSPFAPLHQPHNLAGVRAAREAFRKAVQVGCFDTSFHRGHPAVEDLYALPRDLLDRGVRRYGFHGISYEHLAGALAERAPQLADGRVIAAHLGAGASMCAMRGGRSVASTMGFSALDGLPMATRSGQIDPGVLLWLVQSEGMDGEALSDLLYRRSGLLGLSGVSGDMRELERSNEPAARQAIDYFVHRARREIGALAAAAGGLDALVFSAGIGEHSPRIRARICDGLGWMGLELDADRNEAGEGMISADVSRVRAFVIPTDEERVIARAAARLA
ncbi:MAG: acetate/propionate family kinase [Paracoccaceae bacterium]